MDKAIILCAGFGTRLTDLTKNCPKPMLKINNIPILEYLIRSLVQDGIKDIGINLHYLAEQITDYFQNGKKFNCNITYQYEQKPTGTAGGMKCLQNFLHDAKNIFVVYGDIFTNTSFKNLLDFHKTKNAIGSIYLHQRNKSNSVVSFNKHNRIIEFLERPLNYKYIEGEKIWVNSAIYCFKKEVLNLIPTNKNSDFPKDIFPQLIAKKGLYGLPLTDYRQAIDGVDRYLKAKKDAANLEFHFQKEKI